MRLLTDGAPDILLLIDLVDVMLVNNGSGVPGTRLKTNCCVERVECFLLCVHFELLK